MTRKKKSLSPKFLLSKMHKTCSDDVLSLVHIKSVSKRKPSQMSVTLY